MAEALLSPTEILVCPGPGPGLLFTYPDILGKDDGSDAIERRSSDGDPNVYFLLLWRCSIVHAVMMWLWVLSLQDFIAHQASPPVSS